MKSLLKNCRKFVFGLLVFALSIIQNFSFISIFNKKISSVNAKSFAKEEEISISGGSFNTSSSSYPSSPNNFTEVKGPSNAPVKAGIISVDEDSFEEHFEDYNLPKTSNPSKYGSDDNVLMINSQSGNFGYTTSISGIKSNGNYYVSVAVNTLNTPSASLYLFNNDKVIASITNIQEGSWQKYTFYITTNDYEDMDVKLGLWLGEYLGTAVNGTAFFDEVTAGKITNNEVYLQVATDVDGKTSHNKSSQDKYYYVNYSQDNVVEQGEVLDYFHISSTENANALNSNYTVVGNVVSNITETKTSKNAFQIYNKQANYISFETDKKELLPNHIYKFSLKVKVVDLEKGNAFINVVDVDDTSKTSGDLSISSTTNVLDNDFVEYSVYVNADPIKTKNCKFVFGLGDSSLNAKGNVLFADYKLSQISYAKFSSTTSTVSTLDYTKDYTTSNDFENAGFDLIQVEEVRVDGKNALAKAKGWTKKQSTNNGYQTSGVINTKYISSTTLADDNIVSIKNPGAIPQFGLKDNNVLVMYNANMDALSYVSSSYTLKKNTYARFSVWVQTNIFGASSNGASVILKTTVDDSTIVLAKVENIDTNGNWQLIDIYAHGGYQDVAVQLELCFGSNDKLSSGYAYFDNALINFQGQPTETDFESIKIDNNDYTTAVDISNMFAKSSNAQYANPEYFEGTNIDDCVDAGVVSVAGDLNGILPASEFDNLRTTDAGDVLAINSQIVENNAYFTSKINFNFEADKKYVFKVSVFTFNVAEDEDLGALIRLSGFENAEFKAIKSNSKWTTYTFYIIPESSTTTELVLGIGNEEHLCSGSVFFGNISIEETEDSTDFANGENALLIGELKKSSDDTTVDDEKETKKNKINWVYVSSTFTALAVIIAIVGLAVRKLTKKAKKKFVKKSKIDYDRNKAVYMQKYNRLATSKREEQILEATKEKDAIVEERVKLENEYKLSLTQMRELKLSNRTGNNNIEIAKLEKETKKLTKEISKLGVKLNKINNDIEFMHTEAYLKDLERRLMREDEKNN